MLPSERSRFSRTTIRFGVYLLAIGLLVASMWYAMQGQSVENYWILVRAELWLTAGLFASVVVSGVVLPGVQFWLVTRPFVTGRSLSLVTMEALVAAGSLLNYAPLKAGLFGRVAYLKHLHGVGYRAAILTHAVIVVVFVSSSLLTTLITIWRGSFDIVWWLTSLIGLGVLAGITAPILRAAIPSSMNMDPRLCGSLSSLVTYLVPCFAAQLLTLFFTAIRWWLVFRILDRPIGLADAWLAAVIHVVAVMAGPANGIGLREWLIGIGGTLGGLSSDPEMNLQISISAALVDRAVEAIVLIVLGLLGLAFLRHVQRRFTNTRADG
jgi:hypothetical protein